jgi:hypothetical protein
VVMAPCPLVLVVCLKVLRVYCGDVVISYALIVVFVCVCVYLRFLTFCDKMTDRVTCYSILVSFHVLKGGTR